MKATREVIDAVVLDATTQTGSWGEMRNAVITALAAQRDRAVELLWSCSNGCMVDHLSLASQLKCQCQPCQRRRFLADFPLP